MHRTARNACPCGSGPSLAQCCGRYHGGEFAPDAVSLMRSRYSAFVLGDEAYLLSTWHPSTRPQRVEFETGLKWLGLQVRRSSVPESGHAVVEFVARYRIGGRGHRLHEVSRFRCEQGAWFYVDGDILD